MNWRDLVGRFIVPAVLLLDSEARLLDRLHGLRSRDLLHRLLKEHIAETRVSSSRHAL